jgi:hypothetical protein
MFGAIMAAAPLIGRIFGGAAGGASNQRLNENDQRLRASIAANQDALGRAQLQSQHAIQGGNLDLNRRQFQQNEPNARAGQAVRGSILQNIQPLRLSGLSPRVQARMPQMTSIIDALGPEARQAGALLARAGISGLQNPSTFQPLPQLNLPPAQVAALQRSGILEKILGAGGLIGSTVGALGDLGSVGRAYTDSDWQGPIQGGG